MLDTHVTTAVNNLPALRFRRIIVGIDGSDLSRAAFAFSAMIAEAAGLELHAIHVLESVHGDGTCLPWDPAVIERHAALLGVRLHDGPNARDGGLALARTTLEECKTYCEVRSINFSSCFMFGPLIDRLLQAQDTDMLAVGRGRFAHAGYGSTTRRLMPHAPCPVLIASGALRPINRIIGAYDGSPGSARALTVCQILAEQTGWPLTVLAVAGRMSLSETLQAAQNSAPKAQVIASGPEGRDEARQIELTSFHAPFSLIVAPAYSDSLVNQTIGGGMTGHLLAHLDAPLLLVH
jgi:nucleotide-binding universal stress UspA family protein